MSENKGRLVGGRETIMHLEQTFEGLRIGLRNRKSEVRILPGAYPSPRVSELGRRPSAQTDDLSNKPCPETGRHSEKYGLERRLQTVTSVHNDNSPYILPADSTVGAVHESFCATVESERHWPRAERRLSWTNEPRSRTRWLFAFCAPLGCSIAEIPAADLRPSQVRRWHRWVASQTSTATANRYLSHLARLLTEAILEDLRAPGTNPCGPVRRFPVRSRDVHVDIGRLWDAIDAVERARLAWALRWKDNAATRLFCAYSATEMLRLLLLTGTRRGDARKLRWEDVDLDKQLAAIGVTKSGKQRVVALSDLAVAVFDRQRLRAIQHGQPGMPWVFPGRPEPGELSISNHHKDLRRCIDRVRNELGRPDLRTHDMRGIAATAVMRSEPIECAQKFLDHSRSATTAKFYIRARVVDVDARRGADAVANLIRMRGAA